MESNILEGVIALFIALLILSIINEKAVVLIRSYVKQFRFLAIFICCLLIAALWFNSPLYQPDSWLLKGFAFSLWVLVHVLIYFSQNKWLFRLNSATFARQEQRYVLNCLVVFLFYVLAGYFFSMSRHFVWWNAILFTTLFFLTQATLKKDLLRSIAKGREGNSEKKAMEISFLSISIGILIAFFFHANVFKMIKLALKANPDLSSIFDWKNFPILFDGDFITFSAELNLPPYDFFGILITGFFLSYGSQFFHDMLEYLLELKNLKRTLTAGKETYDPGSIKDVDEVVSVSRMMMVEKVKQDNEAILRQQYPNIKTMAAGLSFVDGKKVDSLIIHLSDDNDNIRERQLYYKLPSGKQIPVPIEVIRNVKTAKIQNRPGVAIANSNDLDQKGTFGCVVKSLESQDKFILTCSHVIYDGSSEDKGGIVNESVPPLLTTNFGRPRVVSESVFYARRDAHNDSALLVPRMPDAISNELDDGFVLSERELDPVNDRLAEIALYGGKSGKMTGVIHLVSNPDEDVFEYDDQTVSYRGLIVFGAHNGSSWTTITDKGDSGSVLVDRQNRAIGLVIGGNDQFSYALPIKKILTQSNCTIL